VCSSDLGRENAEWQTLLDNTKATVYAECKRTPIYNINVNNGANTVQPTEIQSLQTSNSFIGALIKLADNNSDESVRINLAKPTLDTFFASPAAVVEIYGRNGKTLLKRETAKEFLQRLSTSFKLINFVEISSQKNDKGKMMSLKIHEIYKQ
jgi:hypothetical protein